MWFELSIGCISKSGHLFGFLRHYLLNAWVVLRSCLPFLIRDDFGKQKRHILRHLWTQSTKWNVLVEPSSVYLELWKNFWVQKNTAFLLVSRFKEFPKFDLEYILWLRPLHTAKNLCPAMFHTVTVRPKRRRRSLLYHTTFTAILKSLLRHTTQRKPAGVDPGAGARGPGGLGPRLCRKRSHFLAQNIYILWKGPYFGCEKC